MRHSLDSSHGELSFQVINDGEKHLDVENELLRQEDNLQQLLTVDCPQHFSYQSSRAFLVSRKDVPDLLDFDFHLFLPVFEFCWGDVEIARGAGREAVLGIGGGNFEQRYCRIDGGIGGCIEVLGC